MSTKSTTRRQGAKPRSLGILALVASMSLVFAGLVGLGLASPAAADDTVSVETNNNNNHGGGHTPVTICHKGNTITVDDDAVPAHLREHGDAVGPCEEADPCVSADSQRNNDKCEEPDPCKDSVGPSSNNGPRDPKCDDPDPCESSVNAATNGGNHDPKCDDPDPCESSVNAATNGGNHDPKCDDPDPCDDVIAPATNGGNHDPKCEPKCIDGGTWNKESKKCEWFATSEEGYAETSVCIPPDTLKSAYGYGEATSFISLADAQAKALAAANVDAQQNLDMLLAENDWVTGTCPPPPPPPSIIVTNCNDTGSCGQTCEQLGNCQKSVPVTAAASATVLAPAAATVAVPAPAKAPAKKPVKVPAPGSVSAGVAGSGAGAGVSAPTAATVPSAVPAGDGSQAPVLPMWALALIAVGVIGAAAAGKQLMGSKN